MSHNNFGSVSADWSFDRIKDKLDKGQFLSDVEAQFLEVEAKRTAERLLSNDKNRGAAFQLLVAKALNTLAEENHELDRKRKNLPPFKPAAPGNLFNEGSE